MDYRYEVKLTNGIEVIKVIQAPDLISRDTFIRHFMERRDERIFLDEASNTWYNKDQIVGCKLLGE